MTPPRLSSALSLDVDSAAAGRQAGERAVAALGAGVDLALVFFTHHHRADGERLAAIAREVTGAACLVAMSVDAVAQGGWEVERAPAVAILCASLPGARVRPSLIQQLDPHGTEGLAAQAGLDDDGLRAAIVLADPYSVPMASLLRGLDRARDGRGVVVGGMASGASGPNENLVVLDDHAMTAGGVLLAISGGPAVDVLVSQGCKGFGPNLVVTGAQRNVIMTLGGRRALDVAREVVGSLPEGDRGQLRGGLFLGCVVDENKERFGRDDYLIRGVLGADEALGSIAVGDRVRVGQTVRFSMRDATTAHDDLAMLLDAQRLHDPPAGALLISCNGRGTRLFGRPHHDAAAVQRAFSPPEDAPARAKGGSAIDPARPAPVPLAGFFAAGEIGPVSGRTCLHGHTACIAMFRHDGQR